ncbi:LPXTG cell wall anchor domain-containing protein [Enterococcus sp. HY326]|uniref:LPXTG cell wall anchor domain-containing protein n=1 Tax=Enterococcus sp. HY326 TaxID=2971265 RepID=UPI00223EB37C|nr:LPXTG cell wall anchor domain-containing protein [Enterococcus sp. HY326]
MKNKRFLVFLSCLVLLLGFTVQVASVHAVKDAGGQVTVDGGITFYEGTKTSESSTTSSEPTGKEPGGKLPQTGETVRNFSFIGGGLILFSLLIVFLRYKKKKEAEGNG